MAEAPPEGPGYRGVLVLGGARSGKSAVAEQLLAGHERVLYVATGPVPSTGDHDWAARVQAHRARRPARWSTLETGAAPGAGVHGAAPGAGGHGVGATAEALRRHRGPLLLDGAGTWLAAALDAVGAWEDATSWRAGLTTLTDELVAAWAGAGAHGRAVAVSDEVGSGVVPATPAGRLFRDELGRLNQRLAAVSATVLLAVAGRVLPLPRATDALPDSRVRPDRPGVPGVPGGSDHPDLLDPGTP